MMQTIGRPPAEPFRIHRRALLALSAAGLTGALPHRTQAASPGQVTYAVHISLAASWLDPGQTSGLITPFLLLYALHDALVKPMPGTAYGAGLAESWTASEDGLTYDFVLRSNALFHNGDPVTADDVKFSFERYHGANYADLQGRVASIETPDPRHVRFRLKQPWPDFLTFYGGATGAGWIVPRKHIEAVGEEAFKKAPVGAGPYKFVSFNPGVELVLEAFEQYWQKPPSVKRIVMKVIPDEGTRLAALKSGEVDIAYSVRGELAEELRKTPGLKLEAVAVQGTFAVYFPEQWTPSSPWHDIRIRRAVNFAIDHQGINQALTQGYSHVTGSGVIPDMFEFYWQPPKPEYNPDKARSLLAEAGRPNGFDAGFYYCDSSYSNIGEAVVNNLREVGINVRLRPIERAGFVKAWGEKQYKNLIQIGPGASGNAATRMESLVVKGGQFVYGSYPDIDELFPQQAVELDHAKREAILHRMQQLVYEKALYAPIWQLAFLNGVGPRVGTSSFGRIPGFPYTAPYEDITLKSA